MYIFPFSITTLKLKEEKPLPYLLYSKKQLHSCEAIKEKVKFEGLGFGYRGGVLFLSQED